MTAMTGANGRHVRFRELAATALDFPLAPAEVAELAAHLATCPACARLAGGLRFDAAALRHPAELPTSYRLDTAVGAAIAGRRAPVQASRTLLLVAATALLGAALLGAAAVGAYLWRTLNPPLLVVDPSPPVILPTPDPSGEPGPAVPAFTWEIGAIPPMLVGRDPSPVAVGGGDGGFVAVGGRLFIDNTTPSGGTASAWHSADGLAWTPAATEGLALGDSIPMDDEPQPGIADVAWGPAGWVAVGIDIDESGNRIGALWSSLDGATWSRLAFGDAARARPAAVTWSGSRYVVVGTVREEAAPRMAAWLATDGTTFTRVPDSAAFKLGGYVQYASGWGSGGLADVTAAPDGSLIAVGHNCEATSTMEDQGLCWPIALRSADGETWTHLTAGLAISGIGLSSVAASGLGYVAPAGGPGGMQYAQIPGHIERQGETAMIGLGDAAGWGFAGEMAGVPPVERVVTMGDWYLAVSSAGNRIRLWASSNGETWTEVPGIPQPSVAPEHEPDIAAFSDVDLAVAGGRLVITGRNQADPSGTAAFAIVGTSPTSDA